MSDQFENLLAGAVLWAAEQERLILRDGVPLAPAQIADAERSGVAHPERVRLLAVARIPAPTEPVLAGAAEAAGLVMATASGLTLRYGIFLRSARAHDRHLIAHELVHTAQYERLGGFEPFLRRYLGECLSVGYAESPLEEEAIRIAAEICGAPRATDYCSSRSTDCGS